VSFEFWKKTSPKRKRIITIVIIFAIIVIITALATLTPMDNSTAVQSYNELNQTVTALKANDSLFEYIFGNNFFLTMLMFIPFVGPIIGFYAFYNTGVIIGAAAIALHLPPTLSFFALFLTPIAWLEFVSYSIAIAGSVWLSARIFQRGFKHELVNTAKFISICAVLLLISAVIESALV
jgi:uncharacterized membrane protein SpoIIM required for sporulation